MKTVPLPKPLFDFARQHPKVSLDYSTGEFINMTNDAANLVAAHESNETDVFRAVVSMRMRLGVLIHPTLMQLWGVQRIFYSFIKLLLKNIQNIMLLFF